jgi:hypothetical protein
MFEVHWISIIWLVLNLVISFPLYKAIHKFISKKSLMAITLVDLLYKDTIIYIYLLVFSFSIALIHCLLENESQMLDYSFSVLYSAITMFFVCCISIALIFSGGLRLLSLLRNSEEAGLLLLGPENLAIIKIRWISVSLSFSFQCFMILILNAPSNVVGLFYQSTSLTIFEEFEEHKSKTLYLVLPLVALIVNVSTKLYSYHLNSQMESATVHVFTIQYLHLNTEQQKEKFSLSLNSVIGIPIMILFTIVASMASRQTRLLILIPFQMTMMSVLFPIIIISRSEKMKKQLFEAYSLSVNSSDFIGIICSTCKKIHSTQISPITTNFS